MVSDSEASFRRGSIYAYTEEENEGLAMDSETMQASFSRSSKVPPADTGEEDEDLDRDSENTLSAFVPDNKTFPWATRATGEAPKFETLPAGNRGRRDGRQGGGGGSGDGGDRRGGGRGSGNPAGRLPAMQDRMRRLRQKITNLRQQRARNKSEESRDIRRLLDEHETYPGQPALRQGAAVGNGQQSGQISHYVQVPGFAFEDFDERVLSRHSDVRGRPFSGDQDQNLHVTEDLIRRTATMPLSFDLFQTENSSQSVVLCAFDAQKYLLAYKKIRQADHVMRRWSWEGDRLRSYYRRECRIVRRPRLTGTDSPYWVYFSMERKVLALCYEPMG